MSAFATNIVQKNSTFAGNNSNARQPFEKKEENHDVFYITNGIATGDNFNSTSLKTEGPYLDRLDRISFDYRRVYTQLRSQLEAYEIREIIVQSSENFFILRSLDRVSPPLEVLILRILLIKGQLILSFDMDKLPKQCCEGLRFVDVDDSDALNYNVAIDTYSDVTACIPLISEIMKKQDIPKRVSKIFSTMNHKY